MTAIGSRASAEQHFPKITLPWEYQGVQQDGSVRTINRIGDATASLAYHPDNDLWLLSLSLKTGEEHLQRLDAISLYILGEGLIEVASARECSDCITRRDPWNSLVVPLSLEEVELIRRGYYLDFHYSKSGVFEEGNSFIFRIGLIRIADSIDAMLARIPKLEALDVESFNMGLIWLLRRTGPSEIKHFNPQPERVKMVLIQEQKENKNWYSEPVYETTEQALSPAPVE